MYDEGRDGLAESEFLKALKINPREPVATKGMSNLFVTTGEKGKNTYNFDLEIVPVALAHRVVNVIVPRRSTTAACPCGDVIAASPNRASRMPQATHTLTT